DRSPDRFAVLPPPRCSPDIVPANRFLSLHLAALGVTPIGRTRRSAADALVGRSRLSRVLRAKSGYEKTRRPGGPANPAAPQSRGYFAQPGERSIATEASPGPVSVTT